MSYLNLGPLLHISNDAIALGAPQLTPVVDF